MTNPPTYYDVWFDEEQARVQNRETAFNQAFGRCSPSTLQRFRYYAAILCIGLFDCSGCHLDNPKFQSLKTWTPRPWRDNDYWRELCSRAIFADKGAMQLRSQALALLWTLLYISGSGIKADSQYKKHSKRFSPLQNLILYNEVFGLPNFATIAFDSKKSISIIQQYGLGFDVSPDSRQVAELDVSHLATSLPITILLGDFVGGERTPFPAMHMILMMASIQDSDFIRFFMQHNEQNRHVLDCQLFYLSCFLVACRTIPYKSKGILEGLQSLVSSTDGREFRRGLLASLKTSSKPEELALIMAAMISLDHFTPSNTLVALVGLGEFCLLLDREQPVDIDRAVIWHAVISFIRAIIFVYEDAEAQQHILELMYSVTESDESDEFYPLTKSPDRSMEEYWIIRFVDGYSHEGAMEQMCRNRKSLELMYRKTLNVQDKSTAFESSLQSNNRMQGTDRENVQDKPTAHESSSQSTNRTQGTDEEKAKHVAPSALGVQDKPTAHESSPQFIKRMQGTDGENLQNKRRWFHKWSAIFCI
ncbi:MAG: hypothetical protein M1824_001081 [Vezdaea acicularis]|nr:MAG: hypothetical protein M1824_001081 [Vezdaea acicularis]